MAKLHIAVSRTTCRADTGSTLPVPDAVPASAATPATTAASAVVAVMPPVMNSVANIIAIGGSVWLAFGPSTGPDPVAGEGGGWLLQEGESRSFGVTAGQRLAAKDASL